MSTQLYDQVIAAMRSACEDMLRFSGKPARPINAEYLFTVAVAKHIDKLNFFYGDPYNIYLEKNVREFAKDCLLPFKIAGSSIKPGSSILRSKVPKIDNGRIDIAVYQEIPNSGYLGHQPICAIELKGFNPARSKVIEDLKRNLRYFRLTGEAGHSVLTSTIFAAFCCWKRTGNESEENDKVENLKRTYTSWLSELGPVPDIEMQVNAHSVRKDLEGTVTDEGEYQVLDTDTIHHFVGITVEFRPKNLII